MPLNWQVGTYICTKDFSRGPNAGRLPAPFATDCTMGLCFIVGLQSVKKKMVLVEAVSYHL